MQRNNETGNRLPLMLQMFAEGADENAGVGDSAAVDENAAADNAAGAEQQNSDADTQKSEGDAAPPAMTPEGVKKLIDDALAAADTKRTEADKLAKMTKEEREEHERKEQEDALRKREEEITRRELRVEAHKTLEGKNLPVELLDALRYDNAETLKESMDAVEKAFRAAVEAGINDRLRGKPPKSSGNGVTGDGDTDAVKEQFSQGLNGF